MSRGVLILLCLGRGTGLVSGAVYSSSRIPKDIVQKEVFKAGEAGYFYFRIPALLFTSSGSLLAFAEGRGQHEGLCEDHGDVHIVLKRSNDSGETWSKLTIVYSEPNHTIGNPAPVLDATTGKIILAYCRDNKQVFTIESSDEGANWGNVSNITAAVTEPDWDFVGTGPPGGIQLPSGRLIIGAYAGHGGFGSYVIYSDDGGKNWYRSQPAANVSARESQVAALGRSGSPLLMLIMRSKLGPRFIAYSNDRGETWFNLSIATSLNPQTPCEASIATVPYKGVYHDTHLYISAPHSTTRANMTLFASSDGGHSWQTEFSLWEGPSAYSSLVFQDGKLKLFCLYERGYFAYYETLTLAIFSPLIVGRV